MYEIIKIGANMMSSHIFYWILLILNTFAYIYIYRYMYVYYNFVVFFFLSFLKTILFLFLPVFIRYKYEEQICVWLIPHRHKKYKLPIPPLRNHHWDIKQDSFFGYSCRNIDSDSTFRRINNNNWVHCLTTIYLFI